ADKWGLPDIGPRRPQEIRGRHRPERMTLTAHPIWHSVPLGGLSRFSVLVWPSWLCGPQPVDAEDSAFSRSGTPHNSFRVANRPGVAGARVAGDDERARGSRSADPSQLVGQPWSRLLSQRPFRGRRRRAGYAAV